MRARIWIYVSLIGLAAAGGVLSAPFLLKQLSGPAFVAYTPSGTFEFRLPDYWQCWQEGSEWLCQTTEDDASRDAIIIVAEKVRGPDDTLRAYEQYLSAPKEWESAEGDPVRSEVRSVERSHIGGHEWVDALHLESELPGFLTRYLATTTAGIAILVTYSAAEPRFDSYERDLDEMVQTLTVYASAGSGEADR